MSESNVLFLNNDTVNVETSENSNVTSNSGKKKQNLYGKVEIDYCFEF